MNTMQQKDLESLKQTACLALRDPELFEISIAHCSIPHLAGKQAMLRGYGRREVDACITLARLRNTYGEYVVHDLVREHEHDSCILSIHTYIIPAIQLIAALLPHPHQINTMTLATQLLALRAEACHYCVELSPHASLHIANTVRYDREHRYLALTEVQCVFGRDTFTRAAEYPVDLAHVQLAFLETLEGMLGRLDSVSILSKVRTTLTRNDVTILGLSDTCQNRYDIYGLVRSGDVATLREIIEDGIHLFERPNANQLLNRAYFDYEARVLVREAELNASVLDRDIPLITKLRSGSVGGEYRVISGPEAKKTYVFLATDNIDDVAATLGILGYHRSLVVREIVDVHGFGITDTGQCDVMIVLGSHDTRWQTYQHKVRHVYVIPDTRYFMEPMHAFLCEHCPLT